MIKKVMGPGPKKGKPVNGGGGDPIKEGYTLPEFTKTATRIVDKPAKASKPGKAKDWTRKVSSVNKAALKRSGAAAGKLTNILGMRKGR
jgi:hypothetical protein